MANSRLAPKTHYTKREAKLKGDGGRQHKGRIGGRESKRGQRRKRADEGKGREGENGNWEINITDSDT